ncbi:MAG: hypothetical protein Kow00128_10560 [Deltaproteobacteria bacterium]
MSTGERNEIAEAIRELAGSIDRLGNGNASTDFGAIEGMTMKISEAIRDGLCAIADAIRERSG